MQEPEESPAEDDAGETSTEADSSRYKSWNLNSGSDSKTSTSAKSMWKQEGDQRPRNFKRSFFLNSKLKEKNVKFNYSLENNKPILDSLDGEVPAEVQVLVKDPKGRLIRGVNVPRQKKPKKKKALFWKIGNMIIYRNEGRQGKRDPRAYIPVKYELFDTKDKVDQFEREFEKEASGRP